MTKSDYERLAHDMVSRIEIVNSLDSARPNILQVRVDGRHAVLKMGIADSLCKELSVLERTVDSKHTPVLFDSFKTDGHIGILREFIEGKCLEFGERLNPEQYSSLRESVRYLHAEGIYGLDIYPGNILMTPEGRPRLFDFNTCDVCIRDSSSRYRMSWDWELINILRGDN